MTDFRKDDSTKLRLELIPREAIDALGRAFSYGAKKYAPNNWLKCPDPSRYVGAALRHLNAWNGGEERDIESGLSHLDHAIASVAMLVGLVERAKQPAPALDLGLRSALVVERAKAQERRATKPIDCSCDGCQLYDQDKAARRAELCDKWEGR